MTDPAVAGVSPSVPQQPSLPAGFLPDQPSAPDGRYRALFVHAHPDDETLSTGGTMALLAAQGVEVSLLTATRGEMGEVIPAELRYLEQGLPKPGRPGVSQEDGGVGLARVRQEELSEACRILGVNFQVFLGTAPALVPGLSPRAYRDSGMVWERKGVAAPAPTTLPGAFTSASLNEVAENTATMIRAVRPDVIITYDSHGGYGHPDHVRCYEMTMQAVQLAADQPDAIYPAWRTPLIHTISTEVPSAATPSAEVPGTATPGTGASSLGASGVPVESGTADGDLRVMGLLESKRQAMRAYRTQIVLGADAGQDNYSLSDGESKTLSAVEHFHRAAEPHPPEKQKITPLGWVLRILVGLMFGFIAGFLGTMLHLRSTADFSDSLDLPWGVWAAWLLVAATVVFIGTWTKSWGIALLTATTAAVFVWASTFMKPGSALILDDEAGWMWLVGVGVIFAICLCAAVAAGWIRAMTKTPAAR